MKKHKLMAIPIAMAFSALVWIFLCSLIVEAEPTAPITEQIPKPTPEQLDLEHRQETWISALEWCESQGKNSALNKMDRDGTPSYSNFQWKPSTLIYYGQMYGHLATSTTIANVPELLKNYDLQRSVVRSMVKDKRVKFETQFPDCVKRKIGQPPRK